MTLRPVGDHILVEPTKQEDQTASGIYLPETAKEKPQMGVVLAVGQGKYDHGTLRTFADMGIKEGDTVMYSKYGPSEIKLEGKDLLILDSGDVLGVVEK